MQYTIEVPDSLASLLELTAKSHGVSVEEWIEAWLEWWLETSHGRAPDKKTREELEKSEGFRMSVEIFGSKQKGERYERA